MSFGTLVLTGFTRNPLRFLFTFAAIAAAFCLFGVLETLRYQRDTPLEDEGLIVVQPDGVGGFPLEYEATILGMEGVAAATGLGGLPVLHPKSPTGRLIVFGMNAAQMPATFPGMKIPPDVVKRWLETRTGAILDARRAEELGWKPNEQITLQLQAGMKTTSGSDHLELILVGVYPGRSIIDGLIVRDDYLRAAFPFAARLSNLFVRPAAASDPREVASRIDQHYEGGASPTLSAQVSDFREAAARDASTIRLVIRGALAISFFTMVLIVANAIMQSVRERLGEMAVMQALGFQERTILALVFSEVLALFAVGAVVGLILANVGFALGVAETRSNSTILPAHTIGWAAFYVAICASIAVLLPGWELSRLRVADALRRL